MAVKKEIHKILYSMLLVGIVSVVAGHTYVSLAQQGEEGNYIVFRVKNITPTSVVLDFLHSADP